MKVWSIQSNSAYNTLISTGALSGTRATVIDSYFIPAYDWLRGEMSKRIGQPPNSDIYPIWAWYRYNTTGKPDMRQFQKEIKESGPEGLWRLELKIPDEKILLSDFILWHMVLNNSYLSLSEKDDIEHELCSQKEKERSWERIFDLSIRGNDWIGYGHRPIQGTVWQLTSDMIVKAEHFTR